jgi:hypothetical protein
MRRVVVVVGVAAFGAGLAAWRLPTHGQPRQAPRATTPAQLLSAMKRRVGPADRLSATLGSDGSLRMTVRSAGLAAATVRPVWIGDMVAGALDDELDRHHLPRLDWYSTSVRVGRSGVRQVDGGAIFDTALERDFADASDAVHVRAIREGAARAGLSLTSLSFVRAECASPVVVVQARHIRRFAAMYPQRFHQLLPDPGQYEGYYLEVRDATGCTAIAASYSARTSTGHLWVRPDIRDAMPSDSAVAVAPGPSGC